MSQSWHDINDPGGFKRNADNATSSRPVEYEPLQSVQTPQQEPEVRFVSAQWEAGTEGFQFNKKCTLKIKAEFLKETFRKKVTCALFVTFNGEKEDLHHEVDAFLENDGTAATQMTLYYGNAYYNALQEKPGATCEYKAKITHPTAVDDFESAVLEMPGDLKYFRLTLKDEYGGAMANVPYTFAANGRSVHEGVTDAQGKVEFPLPGGVTAGNLRFLGDSMHVDLSPLPSIGTVKGVQARLKGLGFYEGKIDGGFGPKTWRAIHAFQSRVSGLQPTGEIDDATRRKLIDMWDSDTPIDAPSEDLTFKGA
jgi:hypothetical protein